MTALRILWNFVSSFSLTGITVGFLFFAASLTPSLIPRPFEVQGVLSGLVLMTGYGLGWTLIWMWEYLELPEVPSNRIPAIMTVPLLVSFLLAAYSLGKVTDWQNSLRLLMAMEPVSSAHPFRILAVALLTSAVVLLFFRIVIAIARRTIDYASRILPRRIASVISLMLLLLAAVTLVNDVVLSRILLTMDQAFAELNDLIEPDIAQPQNENVAGSSASHIAWTEMGRRGRQFIVNGPTAEEIAEFTGMEAKRPLRVYAGFDSEDNLEAQADKALNELLRLDAFGRSVLIVATPTGTGWLDPAGVDTIEYLHSGDTAIVALQYSYLPSWTTLLIDPDRARRAARALFRKVYGHWVTLPEASRPELYLFGLSLGALGSEHSANFIELLNEPFDGALWSGPPFPSTHWGRIMTSDEFNGPAWLPELKDQRLVRFAGAEGFRTPSRDGWGRTRILYVQHASDPMSFFSPDLLWSSPGWLIDRGPDVSPDVRWSPLVLFFQIGFDIFLATTTPLGYGHNFAPGAYIDGWVAVTDPTDWNPPQIARLKEHFRANQPSE